MFILDKVEGGWRFFLIRSMGFGYFMSRPLTKGLILRLVQVETLLRQHGSQGRLSRSGLGLEKSGVFHS